MKRIIVLLLALMLAVPAFAADALLAGEITAVDKHGNVETNLPGEALTADYALGDLMVIAINSQRVTAPFVRRYSDVNVGEPLIYVNGDGKVCLSINYSSFKDTYQADVGVKFEIELLQKEGYLDNFEIRNLVRSESREDYASDEIFANFRPVIDGVLYRGANPILADDPRSPYVMELIKASNVKSVVNLSQNEEELAEGVYGDMKHVAIGMGADVTNPEFASSLKKALDFIAENDAPFFVHCNEGKDRAGIICAVIEAALGFTPEQITDDYMVSYVNYYGVEKGTEKYALLSQQIQTIMEQILGSPMNEGTLKQTAVNYLKGIGVDTDALLAKLAA